MPAGVEMGPMWKPAVAGAGASRDRTGPGSIRAGDDVQTYR